MGSDKLLSSEILRGLKTRLFRGPIYYYDTAPSTNDLAKELGRQGAQEGTLVVAEGQTGGRGRYDREWISPPFWGLYVSLLLRPAMAPAHLPRLTLTAALAGVRSIQEVTELNAGIKWPNDLYLHGKKVGGLLTEMETAAGGGYLVIGLGLNVNNPHLPAPLQDRATSLALEAGRPFSRLQLLQAWLREFETLYEQFLSGGFPAILAEWQKYCITLGQPVKVLQGSQEISGTAVAVAADGSLLLQTTAGTLVQVISGEITPASEPDL